MVVVVVLIIVNAILNFDIQQKYIKIIFCYILTHSFNKKKSKNLKMKLKLIF